MATNWWQLAILSFAFPQTQALIGQLLALPRVIPYKWRLLRTLAPSLSLPLMLRATTFFLQQIRERLGSGACQWSQIVRGAIARRASLYQVMGVGWWPPPGLFLPHLCRPLL